MQLIRILDIRFRTFALFTSDFVCIVKKPSVTRGENSMKKALQLAFPPLTKGSMFASLVPSTVRSKTRDPATLKNLKSRIR